MRIDLEKNKTFTCRFSFQRKVWFINFNTKLVLRCFEVSVKTFLRVLFDFDKLTKMADSGLKAIWENGFRLELFSKRKHLTTFSEEMRKKSSRRNIFWGKYKMRRWGWRPVSEVELDIVNWTLNKYEEEEIIVWTLDLWRKRWRSEESIARYDVRGEDTREHENM